MMTRSCGTTCPTATTWQRSTMARPSQACLTSPGCAADPAQLSSSVGCSCRFTGSEAAAWQHGKAEGCRSAVAQATPPSFKRCLHDTWHVLQVQRGPQRCARACGLNAECTAFHYNPVRLLILNAPLCNEPLGHCCHVSSHTMLGSHTEQSICIVICM
jgi:hypothetical protein